MKSRKKIIIISSMIAAFVITGIIVIMVTNRTKTKEVFAEKTEDVIPPVITLKGKKEIILKGSEEYKEDGYSAIDNVEGSIVGRVCRTKQIVSEKEYKIIYSVKDKSGNMATAERIIHLEKEGTIYLTFDDGPSESSTPKILDILKKHNIKATFFILNYSDQATENLVKREVAEGHTVGIHGYSHDYKKIYKSEKAYMENLNKLQNKIYQSTGIKSTITRFPGGSSNTISDFNPGIMTKLSKKIQKEGYTYFDWNVDSDDAVGAKNAKEVYNNVTSGLYKKGRNVVLMHDFAGNQKTINALEKIIEYGKKNGYRFETITTDTPAIRHDINN